MVLRSVHKPYAVVGLLVASAAVPTACSSEFEGCKANRTCPAQAGEDSGSGGEAGGGAETGGSSGSSSGTSGAAGMDDGGGSGTGGSSGSGASGGGGGADDQPPTVEAFTPDDGSTDVERDIEVTAELSEPVDEATVTETSVMLMGPDGEVAGTLSVDENVISFVPDRPLYLLGTYTFTLDETVTDLAGNTLEASASAEFRVRDGRWGEPTFPFGEAVPRVVTQFDKNVQGDVVVGMEIWPDRDYVSGAVYHAAAREWSPATELRQMAQLRTYTPGVAIDAHRRALVIWNASSPTTYGWSRFTGDEEWVDAGAPGGFGDVATTPDGRAVAVWGRTSDYGTRTINLSDGALGVEEAFAVVPEIGPYPVASLERLALVATRSTTGGDELVVSWKASLGWSTPEPLASASEIGSLEVNSDEQGNVVVLWRESDQIWSRIYDRSADEWTRELFVTNTSPDGIVLRPEMTAGNVVAAFSSFLLDPGTCAAVYLAGSGWADNSIDCLDDEWTGGAVALSIDAMGNALAVWHSEARFSRYVPGLGWSSTESLDQNVNAYYLWASGAPDGSTIVVSNDTDGMDNRAPWAVRFE